MGNLEKVIQLKQQGQTDQQIIEDLKQQGVSPKEIEEALSQSQIKSALNEPGAAPQQAPQTQQSLKSTQDISADPSQIISQLSATTGGAPMQPSMMQTAPEAPAPKTEPPQPSQFTQPAPETQPFQTSPAPGFQEPLQQEAYPEYQYSEYQPQQIGDVETINEIAEQIVDEKTAELKKQIISFTKFQEETTSEVEKLNERLLKIENTLNELQTAVLRKIGDYGKNIENISKEMHSTQDSFSKILNPLTDNIRELQKITGTESSKPSRPKPKTKSSKSKKQKTKPSFEDYLR